MQSIGFARKHRAHAARSCRSRAIRLAAAFACLVPAKGLGEPVREAALYPVDHRRIMTNEDFRRFPGAGVLFCRDLEGVARRAAAAWLIGDRRLVMMNAHNFRDRAGGITRRVEDCFFQIGGRNYEFVASSLTLGTGPGAKPLHITDDWALLRLAASADATPQPPPREAPLADGVSTLDVTMVSPAGHANFRGPSSVEACEIRAIDPPSEDGIRRARHNCNDGFGGSGSGLFDEAGHLIAMQSASLDMNRRLAFDLKAHYGSALLLEGGLRAAIERNIGR